MVTLHKDELSKVSPKFLGYDLINVMALTTQKRRGLLLDSQFQEFSLWTAGSKAGASCQKLAAGQNCSVYGGQDAEQGYSHREGPDRLEESSQSCLHHLPTHMQMCALLSFCIAPTLIKLTM